MPYICQKSVSASCGTDRKKKFEERKRKQNQENTGEGKTHFFEAVDPSTS